MALPRRVRMAEMGEGLEDVAHVPHFNQELIPLALAEVRVEGGAERFGDPTEAPGLGNTVKDLEEHVAGDVQKDEKDQRVEGDQRHPPVSTDESGEPRLQPLA